MLLGDGIGKGFHYLDLYSYDSQGSQHKKSQNMMIFLKMSRLFLNISLVIKGSLRLFFGWGKSSVKAIT